ncbi:Protein of unknown function [Gryllus bimaculatus]|nr:Protein of unknown function [Gryllus bimaculatus]
MTSRGKLVSLIAVVLLSTEPVELSWQKSHPLLNDVVKMFERQTDTAQAVMRVASPLRNATSEPPVLPVVFEASGEEAPARLRVGRLLKALRASPLWAAAAQQVVALPDATAQVLREAQRALARFGVVRALGISATNQPSPTGVRFNTVQRPSRPPPITHDLRLTKRPVDLRNAPVVFAFVTKDRADEARRYKR